MPVSGGRDSIGATVLIQKPDRIVSKMVPILHYDIIDAVVPFVANSNL